MVSQMLEQEWKINIFLDLYRRLYSLTKIHHRCLSQLKLDQRFLGYCICFDFQYSPAYSKTHSSSPSHPYYKIPPNISVPSNQWHLNTVILPLQTLKIFNCLMPCIYLYHFKRTELLFPHSTALHISFFIHSKDIITLFNGSLFQSLLPSIPHLT